VKTNFRHHLVLAIWLTVISHITLSVGAQGETGSWPPDPKVLFTSAAEIVDTQTIFEQKVPVDVVQSARAIRTKEGKVFPWPANFAKVRIRPILATYMEGVILLDAKLTDSPSRPWGTWTLTETGVRK
jgi:hypothetical protein